MRIFTEHSTWDKPAELQELQLGLPGLNDGNSPNDLEDFVRIEHESVFQIDDFFNPIPPPSLHNPSKGLIPEDFSNLALLNFFSVPVVNSLAH